MLYIIFSIGWTLDIVYCICYTSKIFIRNFVIYISRFKYITEKL